jgi:hypothetical protein
LGAQLVVLKWRVPFHLPLHGWDGACPRGQGLVVANLCLVTASLSFAKHFLIALRAAHCFETLNALEGLATIAAERKLAALHLLAVAVVTAPLRVDRARALRTAVH